MSADTNALLEDPGTSHRVYIGDSIGCLRVAQCSSSSNVPEGYAGPSINTVLLPGFKSHSDHAVQRIARGSLDSSTYVIAMARKNATIDVIHLANQALPSSSSSSTALPVSEISATVLCTIHEPYMKAGIHRWIGLAVGTSGIHSCTSSGVYRFTPLHMSSSEDTVSVNVGEAKIIDTLPAPLQHASFYPTSDPTHFCYGGEDIPVSLWDIEQALSEPTSSDLAEDESTKPVTDAEDGLNSKQRKRKRQLEAKSKARELMWGEIWRAKNLPNDNLSLQRRANVTCTSILQLSAAAIPGTSPPSNGVGEERPVGEASYIAVGTKDGLVRIFEPGTGVRKHVREIQAVPAGQGAVKTLCSSSSVIDPRQGATLFVGDTGSKVYAIDWQAGKMLYGYKSATLVGATLSMAILPPALASKRQSTSREDLITVSSDSLVRVLSTIPAAKAVAKAGSSPEKGQIVWSKILPSAAKSTIMPTPTAVVWDGVLPLAFKPRRSVAEHDDEDKENDAYSLNEDEEDEEDGVWDRLQAVGGAKAGTDSDDDDDNDQEAANGNASSRRRRNAAPKKARK